MAAYYNEIEPYAAQWLRNLIAAGHIAPGDVDERDIRDVRPDDLRGYTQCHFFAGIGVWSYALRLAGWSDDRPVWTGSCPCQPFSQAGQGAGFDDERHVWPAWDHLIRERRPAAILGEQVASKDAEPWLDLVSADLEGLGYAFGALAFPSAGVGAPHIRDRTYFVAHAAQRGRREKRSNVGGLIAGDCAQGLAAGLIDGGMSNGLADTDSKRSLPGALTGVHSSEERTGPRHGKSERLGAIGELADSADIRLDGRRSSETGDGRDAARIEFERLRFVERIEPAGPTNGYWRDADWLLCRDEKWRPVEPGTFPLADGAPSRVGRLRAYGNAINAYQAAEFIAAARETIDA
jgi:DNA (cytosine-5)-methyltransferase 1